MRGLAITVLFVLCGGTFGGQDDNCTFYQETDESIIGRETKLVCGVEQAENNTVATWYLDGARIFEIQKLFNITLVRHQCPAGYTCHGTIQPIKESFKTEVTVKSTTLHEDGAWSCRMTTCEDMELQINVTVPPSDESITMSGLDNKWVDRDLDYSLSCTVDPIKPDASVFWRIGGQLQLQTTTNHSLSPDGKTFWLEGTLLASFSGSPSPVLVECLVTELDREKNILTVKEYKEIEVWYRPIVWASGGPHLLEGLTLTIECNVTSAYPPRILRVQWLKDGANLTRAGVEGGTVDNPTITLRDVHESDAGEYVCLLSNRAGQGRSNTVEQIVIRVNDPNDPDVGAIVGGVFGIVGAAAIAVGVFFVVRRCRKKGSGSKTKKKKAGFNVNFNAAYESEEIEEQGKSTERKTEDGAGKGQKFDNETNVINGTDSD